MAFSLRYCVIHELVKESGKQSVETIIKPLLPEDDKHVINLVISLNELIGKKESQAARGTFDNKSKIYKVPGAFDEYYNGEIKSSDFHSFTKICMNELVRQAKDPARVAASGGAIVFAHYQNGNSHFLLITMVKQKEALRLDNDLKPVGIVQIDLNKIHQAARINFDKYYQYEVTAEEEKPTYLAFVSPKINLDASGYFVAALGCTDSVPSAKATEGILSAVKSYFDANREISGYKREAYDTLIEYLNSRENGELASLIDIENVIKPMLPTDKRQHMDHFVDFLNGELICLPLEFSINKSVLNKHTKVKASSPGWEINFEKRFLGVSAQSIIQYRKEERKIIISRLDDNILEKLDAVLREKG